MLDFNEALTGKDQIQLLRAHIEIASLFCQQIRDCLASDTLSLEQKEVVKNLGADEINTYLDYKDERIKEDHPQFLARHMEIQGFAPVSTMLLEAIQMYQKFEEKLSGPDKLNALAQTENYYHDLIFNPMYTNYDRGKPEFEFFRHYIYKHKEIDGGDGGHAKLMEPYLDLNNPKIKELRTERLKLFQAC